MRVQRAGRVAALLTAAALSHYESHALTTRQTFSTLQQRGSSVSHSKGTCVCVWEKESDRARRASSCLGAKRRLSSHPKILFLLGAAGLSVAADPLAANRSSSSSGGNPKQRRGVLARPPAVDSALLRFVAEQQQEGLATRATPNGRQAAAAETSTFTSAAAASAASTHGNALRSNGNRIPASAATATSRSVDNHNNSRDDDDAWWWGQFHAHAIVSLLTQRDPTVDAAAAQAAGEAVQSQALVRKARRQIRAFLQERDVALGAGGRRDAPTRPRTTTTTHAVAETMDVLLELGLTVKDTATILQHSPGIALMRPRGTGGQGESLATTVTRVLDLLGARLGLRRYDARKVIRSCPGLLTMRRSKAAEQMVVILSTLGVSAKALSRDKAALADTLLRSPSAIFRLVSFLASDAIRMPVRQIGPLLRRRHCRELLDAVAPIPLAGDVVVEKEAPDAAAAAMDPQVASVLSGGESLHRRERIEETYRCMSQTAWILRHEIGTSDLGKVIAAYPSVLLLDAEKTILPNADYLMNELGIWKDDLAKVLQLYPILLGADLDKMRQVVEYLLYLEVPRESLASIFRSFPALLTLDVEKDMEPVVDFLRSIGISNLGRFISRLPPVLGYSVQRELVPKWNYLARVCADPRFEVSRFPAYFSYPLERVIKTRYDYIRRVKGVPTHFMSVDQVVSLGDKDFATRIVGDVDARTFLQFTENRSAVRYAGRGKKGKAPPATQTFRTSNAVPMEQPRR
jgi:hypothetical protein